ncbi:MAG: SEC-C metal-binding domain-containing protein, partial [bacterium]|nr:SEC-C metal-binding domain-containing protein [bacterium]
KYKAAVKDIKARHKKGQPVLVGSITIETSELMSKLLMKESIPHKVLNAKYHEKEAEIIADAGQKHAVTIATNMAGRGTDIKLGDGVIELGGLYVLGTERHESRRIDNQLRGRAGRQGDPGESKFYVALDDDLMRLFGSDRIARVMETLGIPDDTPIEHGLISKSIERAQKKVEQYHFSTRKHILEYDNVMDKQRNTVYKLRREIVAKEGLIEKLHDYIDDIVVNGVATFGITFTDKDSRAIKEEFATQLKDVFPISNMDELIAKVQPAHDSQSELASLFKSFLSKRLSEHPPQIYDEVIKSILLRNLDSKWMDHLHNMDVLREGIGLRAYGQKNPLMEYKMEGFDMFRDLLFTVFEESIKVISRVEVVAQDQPTLEKNSPLKVAKYSSAKGTQKEENPVQHSDKVGRNDPCPCGSGKKHKKCCGAA